MQNQTNKKKYCKTFRGGIGSCGKKIRVIDIIELNNLYANIIINNLINQNCLIKLLFE